MPASVRVASAHVDFSANSGPYQAGVQRAIASNRAFAHSFNAFGTQLNRFRQSVTSSLIATAAYAAGVGGVTAAIGGSSRAFLDYENRLIAVRKTAGLTESQMSRLGENLRRVTTEFSALGRPLPVALSDLQDIAVVAGQMNIRGVRDIAAFTEAVGLLGLTTDLVGEQAANAIGKILETTQSGVDEVLNLGSALTALGNRFRGGEADILSQANFLATQTAAFRLPTQDILAYSAALAAGGQRAETAGTAFQRLFQTLTDAAAEASAGDLTRLGVIVQNVEGNAGTLEERVGSLRDAIQSGDYRRGLLEFLTALRDAGPEGTSGIFTTLFGGQTPPTRLAGIFGFLSQNLNEVQRAIAVANEEWEKNIALLEEGGLFAEARIARLIVVGNKLRDQGIDIGNAFTFLGVHVAEAFKFIEVAASGAAAALLFAWGRRVALRIQATNVELTKSHALTVQNARTARVEARNRLREARDRVRVSQTQARTLAVASTRRAGELRALQIEEGRLAAAVSRRANAEVSASAAQARVGPVLFREVRTVHQRQIRELDRSVQSAERRLDGARARHQATLATIAATRGAPAQTAREEQRAQRRAERLTRAQRNLGEAVAAQNRHLNRKPQSPAARGHRHIVTRRRTTRLPRFGTHGGISGMGCFQKWSRRGGREHCGFEGAY